MGYLQVAACTLLLLLLCCSLAAAGDNRDKLRPHHRVHRRHQQQQHLLLQQEWFSWKRQHDKVYSTQGEASSRWEVWRENYQKIQEHNKANHSFMLGLNEFADLTQEEFAYFYLSTPRHPSEFPQSETVFEVQDSEEEDDRDGGGSAPHVEYGGVDWRQKGCVTSVKNQGQCGSCWAFSATGALEGQLYRSKGTLVSLSEQQLVDCSWNYGNAGCRGGLMNYAFKYVMSNGGICSSSDYPYVGYDNKWNCQASKCSSVAYCKGYTNVYGEDNLAKAVYSYGPVSVAIDASSYLFQFYSSGIYSDSSCSASNLNHGVLVVGYGTSNDNYYWIVKNSWGTSWGSNGYVYMARGEDNMCGIASAASFPTMK